jgi:hypothetical protein
MRHSLPLHYVFLGQHFVFERRPTVKIGYPCKNKEGDKMRENTKKQTL